MRLVERGCTPRPPRPPGDLCAVSSLLALSRLIDATNERVGGLVRWLILAAVLISAGNALVRKLFNVGSNAYLEIQWYLFAGVFMLGAGYVFLHNAHVRIDFVSSKLSKRTNALIDAIGIVVFLIPLCLILIHQSWPLFHKAWVTGEVSSNAGGLIRWPVLLLIPLGFALLLLQALSELVKRLAFLKGLRPEPFTATNEDKQQEQQLAQTLAEEAARREAHIAESAKAGTKAR
jgi:TRAP-type mannitol/chloroaromatic compound transport system permease small subunit